jgi:hypothetical protein
MEKDWVCAFRTQTDYLAEIAKDVLAGEGIQAVVINKQDTNYHFGNVELYVKRDHIVRAKHLLSNLIAPG